MWTLVEGGAVLAHVARLKQSSGATGEPCGLPGPLAFVPSHSEEG